MEFAYRVTRKETFINSIVCGFSNFDFINLTDSKSSDKSFFLSVLQFVLVIANNYQVEGCVAEQKLVNQGKKEFISWFAGK